MDLEELIEIEPRPRPFTCNWAKCGKSFGRKSDLQRHSYIHTNERPFACSFQDCKKRFVQRSALTVHIRTHTGEKPHQCSHIGCKKRFADSSSLARHRRTHTGKKPYQCSKPGCSKSFCRKSTMIKHQKRPHTQTQNRDNTDGSGSDSDDHGSLAMIRQPGVTWMPFPSPVSPMHQCEPPVLQSSYLPGTVTHSNPHSWANSNGDRLASNGARPADNHALRTFNIGQEYSATQISHQNSGFLEPHPYLPGQGIPTMSSTGAHTSSPVINFQRPQVHQISEDRLPQRIQSNGQHLQRAGADRAELRPDPRHSLPSQRTADSGSVCQFSGTPVVADRSYQPMTQLRNLQQPVNIESQLRSQSQAIAVQMNPTSLEESWGRMDSLSWFGRLPSMEVSQLPQIPAYGYCNF